MVHVRNSQNLSIGAEISKSSDLDEKHTIVLEMFKSGANLVSDLKVHFSQNW